MQHRYQARWISRPRIDTLRRTGRLSKGALVDYYNGYLIVEPVGSDLGDGAVLSLEDADYELRPVWCLASKVKIAEARKLLGLDSDFREAGLVPAGHASEGE